MSGLSIWIFAQQRNGKVSSGAYELLTVARRLTDSSNGTVTAILFGHNVGDQAGHLAARGADRAIVADDPALEHFADDQYTELLSRWITADKPDLVIGSATVYGRALFARLAAKLNTGLVADAGGIELKDGTPHVTRRHTEARRSPNTHSAAPSPGLSRCDQRPQKSRPRAKVRGRLRRAPSTIWGSPDPCGRCRNCRDRYHSSHRG